MRISPLVLLLVAMLGCGSGTQPSKPSSDSGGNQAADPKTPEAAAVKKNMTPAQLALGDPVVNSIGMLLVPIPAGEFQMGNPDSDSNASDDEKPQHLVKITKPFYLSVYEVTQQQYEKVMGTRPWQDKENVQEGRDNPATYVSWDDAAEFCRKLSEQEGVDYRLPTEAEWEYTCRAGTTTAHSFGDDVSKLGEHAWHRKNAWDIGEKYAHRVGQKLPNTWGLYDMHGNVLEWCQDRYAGYGSEKVVTDPMGSAKGERRVLRGGSFDYRSSIVRSAIRSNYHPTARDDVVGFRPSRTYNLSRPRGGAKGTGDRPEGAGEAHRLFFDAEEALYKEGDETKALALVEQGLAKYEFAYKTYFQEIKDDESAIEEGVRGVLLLRNIHRLLGTPMPNLQQKFGPTINNLWLKNQDMIPELERRMHP